MAFAGLAAGEPALTVGRGIGSLTFHLVEHAGPREISGIDVTVRSMRGTTHLR